MDDCAKVVASLVPAQWSERIERYLRYMPPGPMAMPVYWYRKGVDEGQLRLLEYFIGDRSAGALIWRYDWSSRRADFVVIAAVAPNHDGASLVSVMMPGIEEYARRIGCSRVRAHTSRNGLIVRLQAEGYVRGETVMIKEIA